MRTSRWIFTAYLASVLAITMWPSPTQTHAPGLAASVIIALNGIGIPMTLPVLEAVANVVMFVPFGILVPWCLPTSVVGVPTRWTTVARSTVLGAAFSLAIETAQLVLPGRVSTVQDVAMNATGAMIGAVLLRLLAVRSQAPAARAA